jgi:hypothetical protein
VCVEVKDQDIRPVLSHGAQRFFAGRAPSENFEVFFQMKQLL